MNGNTASLTAVYGGTISPVMPCSASVMPAMQRAATLARSRPVTLDTNGTVREARGFTSSTKMVSPWIANCTFISPTTFSALAMATVWRRISSCSAGNRLYGGSEQAESPECTPACSICCMMPPITTSLPSPIASTSTSIASFRKRSSSTGLSFDTLTASRM